MVSFDSKEGWYYSHWLFGRKVMPETPRRHWLLSVLTFLAAGLSMSSRPVRASVG